MITDYPLMVFKPFLKYVRSEICEVGDGIVNWHTPPTPFRPTGLYRVIEIQEHYVLMEPIDG
jgi:hypothetical protein